MVHLSSIPDSPTCEKTTPPLSSLGKSLYGDIETNAVLKSNKSKVTSLHEHTKTFSVARLVCYYTYQSPSAEDHIMYIYPVRSGSKLSDRERFSPGCLTDIRSDPRITSERTTQTNPTLTKNSH